jgi:uncharacterized protein Yka (UPF0111/DUF47 family)
MNAFDMISEPVLFGEQLCEHSHRVHRCVELIPALADALLAQDDEKTRSLMEGFCSEAQGVRADTEAQNMLDAIREIVDENGQARRLKREFARCVYSLEKQLDPVTILFLDRCCGALHEVADGTEQTAEHLRLMIR